MSAPLLAAVGLPTIAGAALLLAGRTVAPRAGNTASPVAVAVLVVATGCAALAGGTAAAAGWPFVLDSDLSLTATGTGAVLLPVVLGVATLVLLAATGTEETREPRFAGLMLLFAAAAAVTVLADTLPTLLLGWEVMGATSYALVGYRCADLERVRSGATAFLTTRAADLGLYLAVAAAVAGGAGPSGLAIGDLAELDPGWRHLAAAGILVAALGKAAQLPFSFWLSRAMDGPSPVSALLHSAAMVALGGYLLVVAAPLLAATGWAHHAAAWTGAVTAVALGAVALVQSDLKQLLAASTAAQLGFVVLAAGVGATSAATAHLVGHAAVKALLFLAAGAWLEALGSKRLDTLAGAARRWPAVGALAVVALLSLAGLPPLTLWATKDAVLAGALSASPTLYVLGLVATALSAAYAITALVVLLGDPREDPPGLGSEEEATGQIASVVPLALAPLSLGALGLGVLALPAVLETMPGSVPAEPHGWELALSGVVVLATAGAVAVRSRRSAPAPASSPSSGQSRPSGWLHARLVDWLGLERAAHVVVVGPTLRAAARAASFDDQVVARLVHGVGAAGLLLARWASAADHLVAQTVTGLAAGARRAGWLARRSSATGQLHHYYLQLATGVLLVVVVASTVVLVGSPR